MSDENKIDWKRLMLRKDRPLPKAGCSWAFYIVLGLMLVLFSQKGVAADFIYFQF